MNSSAEFWHVQLPNGSVSTMTLDELDAAFQAGNIDERTYVLKQGETAWATLAVLLGLDEASAQPSATPAPVSVAQPISFAPAPVESVPVYSLRPVVSEVGLDEDLDFGAPAFRSSKKRTGIIAGSIAAVVGVGILVAALSSGSSSAAPPSAAASQPPPAQPATVAAPPAAAAAPAPVAEAAPVQGDRFSDAQKKALLDADKARAAQQKAKVNAAPARRNGGSTYKADTKPVFHKGGNKYDPLNSSL